MKHTDIKSFEDACKALGLAIPEGLPELLRPQMADIVPSHIKAMLKLEIITAALNEDWQWIPDGKTRAYWPWFWFFTTGELKRMSEAEKEQISLIPASDVSPEFAGLGYAYTYYAFSASLANIGSRLAYKNEALARYSGTQFIGLWKEYLFIKIAR